MYYVINVNDVSMTANWYDKTTSTFITIEHNHSIEYDSYG